MGNNLQKRRIIKVNNPLSRLTKQEKQSLKDAFDRIQDNQVINEYQFRLEVLGPQVPESIAQKIIQLFSSDEIQRDVIFFEDLVTCYVVFKNGRPEEIGQLCFELMKMSSGVEYLSREQITLFSDKLVNLNEQIIHTFYAKTEFDPRLPIKKDDFVSAFKKVSNLALFKWVPKLVDGYSIQHMNLDKGELKSSGLVSKLTMIQHEKTKIETESMGFETSEYESMKEFYDQELKKSDPKAVIRMINMMLKDIRNPKLKKYFVDALSKHKALDFKYLTNMVFLVCKENDAKKKLEFLFDLFSFHTDSIKKQYFSFNASRKQMKDIAEIFKLGSVFFLQRNTQINLDEFIQDMTQPHVELDFSLYEKSKFAMIAMMGLQPSSQEDEKEAILTILDNNHNVEAYIQDHLEEEDTFYVINKTFYESWCMNVGFVDDKSYIIKKEKLKTIDNQDLIEHLHELRMKEVLFSDDFILVPKFVFFPLSKWYQCSKVIERKVITYKTNKKRTYTAFRQRRGTTTSLMGPALNQLPENFYKQIGDTTYELEVYPKFFYYEKINDKGERPHQKAIVNQKIDQQYLKKVIKQDKIPFFEMLVSKKKTFEDVLKDISTNLKENYKRGRLWIEDQIINGAKLEMTLEEFGISIGQVVYAEYANSNNQWPTDKLGAGPVSGEKKSSVSASQNQINEIIKSDSYKTVGLYNLGNTCYMNSALQCLANTKFFYEYFMKEQQYLKQMNLKNKLGHQGELASNFAQLLQKMYSQSTVVVPRNFKNSISQISEQFQGYEQQDSQEFLAFLLDGLHEELNLRKEKPYIENPDSDDRKIVELGLESWSNTLKRDWSFIFFVFFGQLKSTLNCQVCNKISTTFDVFTNIPLSLPEPSKVLLHIIIYRLPNEIKDIIHAVDGKGVITASALKRIDSARSDDMMFSQQNNQNPANLFKVQESIKYATNDQPIHIALRVDRDIKISALSQLICEVREVNIDLQSQVSTLVLYSQIKGIIRGIFNQDYKLTQYNLITNEIEAVEILSRKGRETIKDFYRANSVLVKESSNAHLTCLLGDSEKSDFNNSKQTQSSTTAQSRGRRDASKSSLGQSSQPVVKIDKCNLFNSYQVAYERYQDFEDNGNFPEEIFTVAYHRRFVKRTYYFFTPYQPQLFSSPILFVMPLKPTGMRVYQEVWAVAQNILKKDSKFHNKNNLWWEQPEWEKKLVLKEGQQPGAGEIFKPFVLKTVDRSGYACSQCNWMLMCSGCIIPPTDQYIEDFFKKCHIAIEWQTNLIEEDYNSSSNEVVHHASTQDKEIIDEEFVNLEDCLRKFHEIEEIGQNDQIYCSGCRKHQAHLKKLEIFRPPPILIIQLKRFKFSNVSRIKLSTLVEFPLYNLDLSTFVTDQEFLSTLGVEAGYDLYAMINHFGTLHFGHYVAIVKNQSEGKWYKYDDSTRTQIAEDQIPKESAYILFYIRRDVQKKALEDILPHIRDLFPGKPVKTQTGDGFIIQQEDQDVFKVQYEKGKDTQTLQKDLIFEEADQNEFVFDAKDMAEIASQKKERFIDKQRTVRKKRNFLCCGINSSIGGQGSSDTTGPENSNKKAGNFRSRKRTLKQNMFGSNTESECTIF